MCESLCHRTVGGRCPNWGKKGKRTSRDGCFVIWPLAMYLFFSFFSFQFARVSGSSHREFCLLISQVSFPFYSVMILVELISRFNYSFVRFFIFSLCIVCPVVFLVWIKGPKPTERYFVFALVFVLVCACLRLLICSFMGPWFSMKA